MKLKEGREISLYNKLPLIFFLCSAVTITLRAVQMFLFIDRETGFYTGGGFLKAVLYSVLLIACVLFAAVAFLSKKTSDISLTVNKNKSFSVLSALLALSFLYDSFSAFAGSFSSIGSISYGASAFQSMMLSGTLPQLFQSVFALLSAIYFLVFAKGVSLGNDSVSKRKILAVAPVVWAGFRLIYRFVEQISYIRVSELLLELVLLALLVLFFMSFAQVASGVYVKNVRWRIVGLGLPAALVSLTLNIPRVLFVLLNGTDTLYGKYPFKVSDFVIALFIAVLVTKLIKNENEPVEV